MVVFMYVCYNGRRALIERLPIEQASLFAQV